MARRLKLEQGLKDGLKAEVQDGEQQDGQGGLKLPCRLAVGLDCHELKLVSMVVRWVVDD